ncbi:transporter [Humibacter ginsenosidimutans]|uniref:Transporter n=1 Tax=Humibacter ginsenosidimutans TaxID=2599293 RepID=A0A5B8M4L7_9MICO|nr:transporter [Humibacter ginsenosidimutans]QDZ15171.1 transporter [Humibacter ginsenosidimutans]
MVAALVRLRLLVLRNSFKRSVGQLIAVIIGGLYGLFVLGMVIVGLFALNLASIELARTIVVLAGSVLVLGWAVMPLLFSVEQTLDAPHLAAYPIPLNKLLLGLLISGVVGIPGAITTIACVFTFGSWLRMPGIAALALLCGIVGALFCVMLSRAVTSAAAGLASGRRFREAAGILIFIPLLLLGPIIAGTTSSLRHSQDVLPSLADAMSWTPLGAVWAIPSQVALGDPLGALWRALIALATIAVVYLVWRWGLARALVTPVHTAAKVRAQGKLGMFARMPATPAGAIAARSLIYWFRDPRYVRQLVIIPIMPILFWFYSSLTHVSELVLWSGPLVAFLLGVSLIADVSFDSTAFVLHVSKGVPGRADRWGRASAVLFFGLPASVAVVIVTAALTREWALVPALLGLAVGLLLGGLAVCSVTSSVLVYPAPAPGDNPFKTRPGANTALMGSTFLSWGVLAVLTAPEIVFVIVAVVSGEALWGWIALVLGVVLGPIELAIGVRLGGRILDRRAPLLLMQLQKDA